MDLKLTEVSELLQVSETTIKRWLQEGKIPAYLINDQYRFSRDEIQDWVIKHKINPSTPSEKVKPFADPDLKLPSGQKQYSLTRALMKGGVYIDIEAENKQEILLQGATLIAPRFDLDPVGLQELLLEREKLHSTALGHGIAVPHTRDLVLRNQPDSVTLLFPKNPISYGALDKEPIFAFFFLFASDDARHLHLLAKIAHLISKPEVLIGLKQKPSLEKLLDVIKEGEARM